MHGGVKPCSYCLFTVRRFHTSRMPSGNQSLVLLATERLHWSSWRLSSVLTWQSYWIMSRFLLTNSFCLPRAVQQVFFWVIFWSWMVLRLVITLIIDRSNFFFSQFTVIGGEGRRQVNKLLPIMLWDMYKRKPYEWNKRHERQLNYRNKIK